MPYKAVQNGEQWNVVNDDNEVKATHQPPDAESKAKRQVDLLNEVEQNPEWDENDA